MLILRRDILEKIKTAELFVFNVGALNMSSSDTEHLNVWQAKAISMISSLNKIGIRVVGIDPLKQSISEKTYLGIELIEANGNRKLNIISYFKGNYSFRDIIFMGNDVEDIDIVKYCKFSATTINAPLELKMESQYVSNLSGIQAFEEIGNIIIHAKRDNGQH